jgi:hypothetical protein
LHQDDKDDVVDQRIATTGGKVMTGATTHILRASLRPKLYRDIEIDSGKSLYDLAEGIVRAFDFDLDHAFGFYSKLTGMPQVNRMGLHSYGLFRINGESGAYCSKSSNSP